MTELFENKRFIILTGNYGSGKTEIALNLALRAAEREKTTLVDLDIVNPYFRSGEKADELREKGIRVLMPVFAMTTVDIPALPAEIQSVFESDAERIIFDVGGDDTGAAALGRYFPSFMMRRQEVMTALVVNCMRPLTETREDILDLAERIQARGRLKLDMLINNTNLADQSDGKMLLAPSGMLRECARELDIPRFVFCGTDSIIREAGLGEEAMVISRKMVPEWMREA
ncbi:MAG: hypothetical protein IJI21_02485 [Clostridia bacterium]|nr:hypothetical protein [Clostridia bacterium]